MGARDELGTRHPCGQRPRIEESHGTGVGVWWDDRGNRHHRKPMERMGISRAVGIRAPRLGFRHPTQLATYLRISRTVLLQTHLPKRYGIRDVLDAGFQLLPRLRLKRDVHGRDRDETG